MRDSAIYAQSEQNRRASRNLLIRWSISFFLCGKSMKLAASACVAKPSRLPKWKRSSESTYRFSRKTKDSIVLLVRYSSRLHSLRNASFKSEESRALTYRIRAPSISVRYGSCIRQVRRLLANTKIFANLVPSENSVVDFE